jgi:hypothetical protein
VCVLLPIAEFMHYLEFWIIRLDMYVVHVQIFLVYFINIISFKGVQKSALPSYLYEVRSVRCCAIWVSRIQYVVRILRFTTVICNGLDMFFISLINMYKIEIIRTKISTTNNNDVPRGTEVNKCTVQWSPNYQVLSDDGLCGRNM